MKIERMMETETAYIQIGDRIHVDHYTATCQEITPKGALFLLDQYLDRAYQMNRANTNKGGYAESDLRKALQSEEVLNIFADIRDHMIPFESGDLLRLPFAGEMFGDEVPQWIESDSNEQWPLMQDRRNRLASRCGNYEWGWINNKVKSSSSSFCYVTNHGDASYWAASNVFGVRPAFMIAREPILEGGRLN